MVFSFEMFPWQPSQILFLHSEFGPTYLHQPDISLRRDRQPLTSSTMNVEYAMYRVEYIFLQ